MIRSLDNPANSSARWHRIGVAAIVIVILATLWPLATHDFTTWDDTLTIAGNPHLNPPTLAGLWHHWTHFAGELYVPLTYTAWWSLAWLGQTRDATGAITLNPWIFHGANLLLHVIASLIVFRILARMGEMRAAIAGAMIFAIHPVQVEAVAWASGTKDVLCGLLCLAALDQYLIERDDAAKRRLPCRSMLFYIAAMLAKPTAMAFPLIVFVAELFLMKRAVRQTFRQAIRSAIPFALLAIPCAIWTKLAQPASLIAPIPLAWRPFVAGDAIAFYLGKILWPATLVIDYSRSPRFVIESRIAFATFPILIAILMMFWAMRRRIDFAIAGFALFIAGLMPVLGLVPFEFQAKSTVGDHYLYLPMLGIAMPFAGAIDRIRARPAVFVSIAIVALLAIRSHAQTRWWRDSATLFTHNQKLNPNSTVAAQSLMFLALESNDGTEAERQARHFISISPNDFHPHVGLADALARQGRLAEALDAARLAAQRWPDRIETHGALAAALIDMNHPREAIDEYDAALKIDPDNADLRALRARAAAMISSASTTQSVPR